MDISKVRLKNERGEEINLFKLGDAFIGAKMGAPTK